jgi:hypothetical protein
VGHSALQPPDLPAIPADTPAKLRPVYDQLRKGRREELI